MVFSGIPFLYFFLPVVILLYAITPGRFKNSLLFLSSLCFYAWGEKKLVLMLVFAIFLGYTFGFLIEKYRERTSGKILLALLIIINIAMLGYFKYADFFISNFNAATGMSIPLLFITLPIGISFYTFQILSYGVDVYRGDTRAERNFIDFGTYVSFFPQLIAGPIVRFVDISEKLKSRTHSIDKISYGITRFAVGLGKKVIFANAFGRLCVIFRERGGEDVLFYWIYALAFLIQIYYDFSGYSDMAIGLGAIFGFDIRENFNYPYRATSITDFWRRWHMSLGSWFRDYVYIPLGGSRCGRFKQIFNILVVWMLTGFWHGASWNFVFWGLMYAILLGLEKFVFRGFAGRYKRLGNLYTMFFVTLGFVLFNASDLSQAARDIAGMFSFGRMALYKAVSLYYLKSYLFLFICAFLGFSSMPRDFVLKLFKRDTKGSVIAIVQPAFVLAMLLISTALLVGGSFNPFLYFRF